MGGFESLGAPTNEPRGRVSQAYQVVDALVWIRGSHTFKTRRGLPPSLVRSYNDQFSRGRLSFNSLADLLAGVAAPSPVPASPVARRAATPTPTISALFVQDDWKVTRRLTLNFGLRHEYTGPLSEKIDRISNFIPAPGLVQVGQGLDTLYERDLNNFAPRVGFAFDPAGKRQDRAPRRLRLLLRLAVAGFLPASRASPTEASAPIRCPASGTFTVNFTGPVPFGPGVDIFGARHAGAALHRVRRGPAHADTLRAELQLQRAADPCRRHGAAGRAMSDRKGTKMYRVRDINQATRRTGRDPAGSAGLSTRSIPISPAYINWKRPPMPITTLSRCPPPAASPKT